MPPVARSPIDSQSVGYVLYGTEGEERSPANVGYYHRVDRLRAGAESAGFRSAMTYSRRNRADRSVLKRMMGSGWLRAKFAGARCVYCASADTAAMGVWAMRKTGIPVMYDIHTPPVGEKWLQFKLERSIRNFVVYVEACIAEAIAIKRADYILWSSLVQKEYYGRRGFPPERLREVRHGVDPDRFEAGPVPKDSPRLLAYAGTMVPYQGADKLVEAFQRMEPGSLRLRMIGFTEREAELRRAADSAGIEAFPQIPQTEVAAAMRDAHCTTIIAHPDNKKYKNGAAPTKWPESLALGRPVLSMDVYDTALMIPSLRVGWVVPNSVEGLVDGLQKLRDCPQEELQSMGELARAEAEKHYAWPVVTSHFVSVVKEAVPR